MMQPLSADAAIGPAWRHTRALLFAPRRLGLLLKLTFIACLTLAGQGASYNPPRHVPLASAPREFVVTMFAFQVLMSVVFLIIGLVFFYLGSRLQFVLFEVVLRRDTVLGPIWTRYGRATWRWIGLKLFIVVPLLLLMVPLTIRIMHVSEHSFPPGSTPGPAAVFHIFAAMLRFMLAIMAVGVLFAVFFALAQDFGLPSMALESTSIRDTIARVLRLCAQEPGPVAFYVLLRMLFMVIGGIVAEVLAAIASFIALVPFAAIGFLLYKLLMRGSVAAHLLFGFGIGLLVVAYLALLICFAVIAVGSLYVFLQAYALFFLAGRYPMVGQYMERYLPQPIYTHPAFQPTPFPPTPPAV